MSLGSSKHFPPPDNPPYHREKEISDEDDGDVVHVVCLDGHNRGETEEDRGEDCPEDTTRQSDPTRLGSKRNVGVGVMGTGDGGRGVRDYVTY